MRARRTRLLLLMVDGLTTALMLTWALLAPGDALAAGSASGPAAAPSGTEIPALRGERSRTYELPGGRRVTRLYGEPVNFRDGDQWRPVDSTLVEAPSSGYVHRRAGAGDALIPTDLAQPLDIRHDGARLSFHLRGASGAADVSGSRATFANALDGVDVTYASISTGVKETLTLKRRGTQRIFTYDITDANGLVPRTAADGAVVFADRSGHDRFAITPPVVWDAATPASVSHAATMTVEPSGDGWRLTVAVDHGWLENPDRAFPVTVDPNVQWITGGTMRYSGAQRDCTLASGTPSTSLCNDPTFKVGTDASGTYKANFYFNVRSAIPQDATIYDATLLAHVGGSGVAPASYLRVRRITSNWTNAATWNTEDGSAAWATPGGDVGSGTDDVGPPTTVSGLNAWTYYRVPAEMVQSWIWGDNSDYGLQLSADSNSAAQVLDFTSTDGDPYKWPALDLYWWEDMGGASFYTLDRQQLGDRSELAVNVANGQMSYTANELSLPGTAGLDLNVTRIWQSVRAWNPGAVAMGWTYSYSNTWTREDADGSIFYIDMSGHHSRFAPTGTGTFKSPPAVNAQLCKIDVASGCTRDGVSGVTYKLTENKSGRKYYYWAPSGRLGAIKDRNGNTVTLDWQTSTVTVSGTQGRQITFSKDASGYTTSLTDGTRTAAFGRGTNDFLTTSTDLGGKTWHYEYDSDGNLTKITDPLGHETRIEWGWSSGFGLSRVVKVIRVLDPADPTNPAKNPTTTYDYDPANRKTVVTNPVGNSTTTNATDGQTTYTYDKRLRVTKAVNPKGLEAQTTWTDNSDIASFEDQPGTGNSQLTTFGYDSGGLGNLKSVDRGAGEHTAIDYFGSGAFAQSQYAPKSASGPDNQSQFFGYDGAGNLTDVKDGDASDAEHPSARNSVHLDYGASPTDGTVKSATDGNGNKTTFGYTNHQLTSITPQPDTSSALGATTLAYDGLGRVSTVQDGKGVTHTFSYDAMDRVTKDEVSASSYVAYSWDDAGNLTERKEVQGTSTKTTTYGYDPLNRRTSETFPGYSNTYTYTLNSQLATLTEPGGTTAYEYDRLDRVTKVTDPSGAHVDWTYDDTGTSTSPRNRLVAFPDSAMTQQTDFDQSGKPTLIVVKSGSTVRASRAYEYTWTGSSSSGSHQGSKVSKVTEQDGTVTTYQYGQDGELLDAKRTTSGGVVDEWVFTYDNATNRKTATRKHTGQADVKTTYAYNKVNQLCWSYVGTSANGCASPPAGATTYSYDADGNQVTGGPGGGFAYDGWNRLTTIGTTSLGYLSPTNGELVSYGTTSYTNNVLGLSSQATGTSKTYYVRDPSGAAVAQRRYSGSTYLDTDYFLTDALGSTVGLVNGTSTSPVRTYSYDPDGNATGVGTGPTTDLKFAGGHALSNGLYHFGARFYNPQTGRWTQPDPLNQIASLTEANRYAYVGGDPVNYIDPTGSFWQAAVWWVGAQCVRGAATSVVIKAGTDEFKREMGYSRDTSVTSYATAAGGGCAGGIAGKFKQEGEEAWSAVKSLF